MQVAQRAESRVGGLAIAIVAGVFAVTPSSSASEEADVCPKPVMARAVKTPAKLEFRQSNYRNPFKKLPLLTKRGVNKVGVLVIDVPEGQLVRVAFASITNTRHSVSDEELGVKGLLSELLFTLPTSSGAAAMLDLSGRKEEIFRYLKRSRWSDLWSFDAKTPASVEFAHSLRDSLGIQSLLIVEEKESAYDFIRGTNVQLGSAGIYNWDNLVFAQASFRAQWIDLDTGRIPDADYHSQESTRLLSDLPWRGPWRCYSDEEHQRLRKVFREIYVNNVNRMRMNLRFEGEVPESTTW